MDFPPFGTEGAAAASAPVEGRGGAKLPSLVGGRGGGAGLPMRSAGGAVVSVGDAGGAGWWTGVAGCVGTGRLLANRGASSSPRGPSTPLMSSS